jgi:hypothetical protein
MKREDRRCGLPEARNEVATAAGKFRGAADREVLAREPTNLRPSQFAPVGPSRTEHSPIRDRGVGYSTADATALFAVSILLLFRRQHRQGNVNLNFVEGARKLGIGAGGRVGAEHGATRNDTADDYPQNGCMRSLSFRKWHKVAQPKNGLVRRNANLLTCQAVVARPTGLEPVTAGLEGRPARN